MEQIIKSYHGCSDDEINRDIANHSANGWQVQQFQQSLQVVREKLQKSIVILYQKN